MKITCSKRDDILKARDSYEAEYQAQKDKYSEEYESYRKASHAVTSVVKEEVLAQLSVYRALKFDVQVRQGSLAREDGLSIRIMCNEYNKFDQDVALSWSYNVELDKSGNVVKESSSWSGLRATTEAQMESLTQTVEALKYLNSVDWTVVLSKETPKYEDYVTTHAPYRGNRPNFEQQLLEVDIEEAIAKGQLIKGTGMNGRGVMWYSVIKETPKQYTIAYIWDRYVEQDYLDQYFDGSLAKLVEQNKRYPDRISKERFINLIDKPIVTKEVS